MSLIHLRHYHKKCVPVSHPLLDGCKAHSESELSLLVSVVMLDPDEGERLVLALRSCLRNLVGRFLANFQSTKPFRDDMVSEGFLAICEIVDNLSLDILDGRSILYVASQRAQNRITHMLNGMKSLSAPAVSTQELRIKNDDEPIYLSQITLDEELVDVDDKRMMFNIRDVYEALGELDARDRIDAVILCPANWGRTEEEIADELGIDQATINRRKSWLYNEFLKLTR